MLRRTPEGLLLSTVRGNGAVRLAEDGLPVLEIDTPVMVAALGHTS